MVQGTSVSRVGEKIDGTGCTEKTGSVRMCTEPYVMRNVDCPILFEDRRVSVKADCQKIRDEERVLDLELDGMV
jgi:hypothetical protein